MLEYNFFYGYAIFLCRFNHCVMFKAFLVFRLRRIVFLVIVKAVSRGSEFWVGEYISARSLCRQKDRDGGMLQLVIKEMLLM